MQHFIVQGQTQLSHSPDPSLLPHSFTDARQLNTFYKRKSTRKTVKRGNGGGGGDNGGGPVVPTNGNAQVSCKQALPHPT
jgi:hypothetical protein